MVDPVADVDLCSADPGFEVDVLVTADLATFYKLWWGRITYEEAIHDDAVTVEGLPRMVRAFPDWFAWGAAVGMNMTKAARQLRLTTA